MKAGLSKRAPGDDLRLIEGLKSRETETFKVFVETFGPPIFRFVRLKLGDAVAAEDASQEIFLKAFMKIETLNSDRLFPWMLKIARNHCFDILRKRRKTIETPVGLASGEDGFARGISSAEIPGHANDESGLELPAILHDLSEPEREIVLLRVIEELEYCEIAQITGMAEGSIRNAFSRAMRRLREGAECNEM